MKRLTLSAIFFAILWFAGCSADMPDSKKPQDPAYSNMDRGSDGGGGGGM